MQTATLASQTLQMPKEMIQKGFVVLGLDEYEELKRSAAQTYYLSDKAAEDADQMVAEGLREHKEGKTRKINSLADLR